MRYETRLQAQNQNRKAKKKAAVVPTSLPAKPVEEDEEPEEPVRGCLPFYVHRHTLAIACEQVGLAYRPVPAPLDEYELDILFKSLPDERQSIIKNAIPTSWEIMEPKAV